MLGSLKLGGCTYYTTILDSQSKPHYWVVQQLPEGVTDVPDTWKTVITPEIKKVSSRSLSSLAHCSLNYTTFLHHEQTDDPKSPDVKTKVNQLGHVYDPRQDPHRYGYGFGGEVVDIVPPESITHLTALEDWMRRLPTLTPLLARTSDKEKPVEQKKSTLVTSDPGVAEKQKVAEQPTREATTGTSAAMPPRGRASSADSAPPKVAKPAETAHPTGDPKRLSWDSFSAKFNRALFGPSATDKTEGVKPLEFSFGVSEESFVPH